MTTKRTDFSSMRQRLDAANRDISDFKQWFILNPSRLMEENFVVEKLNWKSVSFNNEAEISKIPDDKRGIYAFVICWENDILPQNGYVLYVGIAGKNSNRSLRARYKDYLSITKVQDRTRIARAIGLWEDVLKFFFAPIDDNIESKDLQLLERQMNEALLPPCCERDFDAETRQKMRAF